MRTRSTWAIAGVAAMFVLPQPAATAHDHRAPGAAVITSLDSAEPAPYTTTWATGNGRACITMFADGVRGFGGPPVQWLPGTEIAVRFDTRHKPARVAVSAYLLGDPTTGTPVYGAVPVPYELRRVRTGGEIAWEAVLSPPPAADLFVDVLARWKDRDGCGMQESAWAFRAGLLPI